MEAMDIGGIIRVISSCAAIVLVLTLVWQSRQIAAGTDNGGAGQKLLGVIIICLSILAGVLYMLHQQQA